MKSKLNIAFIGYLPGFGGAEKSMIMTANGLSKLGNKVTIISFKDNNVAYNIDESVWYIFIPDSGKTKFTIQFNRLLNLKKALSKIKPDISISFWVQPAIYLAILSTIFRYKSIYSERGDPNDREYFGLLKWMRNLSFRFMDGFVFQTIGASKHFSKTIQKKGVIINNPVYIKYDDYELPKSRSKRIVTVGRLHEQKNQKLLISAFFKICNRFSEYKLEIYGEGHLKETLQELIVELNLEDRVYLKGVRNNIFDEIVDASIFVLSSDYEGMPNALMEAMALGIPCISTDCRPGGAKELIKHGYNGLITTRKSQQELVEALTFMLENPKEANRMGNQAKDICNTHSAETTMAKWNDYINTVLQRSP